MTRTRLPTFLRWLAALIACCACIRRCQRPSMTSAGTGSGRALADAPATGSKRKQPTRSSLASASQSSSSSKSASVSPGKPTMKVERMARSGTMARQRADAVQRLLAGGRALHRLQDPRAGMLEGDVEVGKDLALGHQRDDLVDMRVGIDVVEADPGAERAQLAGEIDELGAHVALLPAARRVFHVDAVGAGVLRDDQQFLHAGLHQPLGLAQHVGGRARDEIAAQLRDDAEGAAVIAAFGNLQIGVVARRQLDALRRHQVDERDRAPAARRCAPRRPRSRIAAGR